MDRAEPEVTNLLIEWRNGNQDAFERLFPLVYDELRKIAKRYMSRESSGHTLQTEALVNEAYLRLVRQQGVDWKNRAHFFAISAQIMRHLLVDHARSHNYAKRGGGAIQISLNEGLAVSKEKSIDLLALDEALSRLEKMDERKNRIVELRYFAGLSSEETAEVLGISEITVKREWLKAKAWLFREITSGSESEV
ncbi:MAG: sigma-70 family RNA polymerase sigma factor [Acidobacteria bacterium]|nr:sigma-70 family RNA polymerase sigma factor [Acidobacteriota bacterium]